MTNDDKTQTELEAAVFRRLVGMLARKGYPAGLAFAVVRQELATGGEGRDDVGGDDAPF